MPNFKYEVVDAAGRSSKGVIEAATINDASKMLRADGRFIASLEQDTGASILSMNVGSPKLKTKDLMIITRQLSSLLSAGITVIRSLDMLYQQLESKKAKAVIGSVYESIQAGKTLSEAFREQSKALPTIMISMISAGMVYPIILAVVTFGITVGLMTLVVPRFAVTLNELGGELPGLTKAVMSFSDSIVDFWYIYIGVILAIVVAFRLYIHSEKGSMSLLRCSKPALMSLHRSAKRSAAGSFPKT